MSTDLVTNAISPVAPFQPASEYAILPGMPKPEEADFGQLVSAELAKARALAAVQAAPSLQQVVAPKPPEAVAPPKAIDTASPVYPPQPPAAPVAPAAPAPVQAAPAPVAPAPTPAAPASYTVQAGDSLSKIARRLGGDAQQWHKLYELNRSAVGANPNMIHPGLVLQLPPAWNQVAKTVEVQVSAAPPVPAPVVEAPAPAPVAAAPVVIEAPAPVANPDAEMPTIEAANEVVEPPARPNDVRSAQEAIERISATPAAAAGTEGLDAMREALKLVPTDSPDYAHFRQTVDGYEAAVQGAANPAGVVATPAPAAPVAEPAAAAPVEQPAVTSQAPTPEPVPVASAEPVEDMDAPPVGFY